MDITKVSKASQIPIPVEDDFFEKIQAAQKRVNDRITRVEQSIVSATKMCEDLSKNFEHMQQSMVQTIKAQVAQIVVEAVSKVLQAQMKDLMPLLVKNAKQVAMVTNKTGIENKLSYEAKCSFDRNYQDDTPASKKSIRKDGDTHMNALHHE